MIYDSIIFFNELDLLELRLKELWDVVDGFFIVEMPVTYALQPKPSYLKENWNRFKPYSSKIQSINVTGWPENGTPRELGVFHRNHQRSFDFKEEDIISICDADEIPHPSVYPNFQRHFNTLMSHSLQVKLSQRFFQFWIDTAIPDVHWCKASLCNGKSLKENDPSQIRINTTSISLYPGGWHFSTLGNEEHIQAKLKNYSHHDDAHCVKMLQDKDHFRGEFLASGKLQKVTITDEWPKSILNNMEFWKRHLCDR